MSGAHQAFVVSPRQQECHEDACVQKLFYVRGRTALDWTS
jgi:hypothetical protein